MKEQTLFEEDRFEDIQALQILSTKMYREGLRTGLGLASAHKVAETNVVKDAW